MIRIFLKYYLPALIWAGIIFYFSSVPGLQYATSTTKEIILRKGAHFVEYAVLGFLLWRIFYAVHKFSIQKSFWSALVLSILYAFSDEFHQRLVYGRTGKIIDVVFDAASTLFILEFITVWIRKKIDRKNVLILFFSFLFLIGLGLAMIKGGLENQAENSFKTLQNREAGDENSNSDFSESKPDGEAGEEKESEKLPMNIPEKISIQVPFTSQAPFAVWDEYHQEACEEVSLIMIKYYLDGKSLNPRIAEKEIQDMITFEIKKYGDYKDTDARETVRLARDFYGIGNLRVIYDFSKDDLKKHLSAGKPIVVPAAGRMLGNPNFTSPGPLYHMLVLVGYDKSIIITNDPGTKRGEDYKYNIDTLYNAIHDFTGDKKDIKNGRKAMIIME